MRDQEILDICSAVRKGAEVRIGRNHLGKTKIKLARGPFGLWVERFEANEEQAEILKQQLCLKTKTGQREHLKFQPKMNTFHRA
jgi:hypothetical protein